MGGPLARSGPQGPGRGALDGLARAIPIRLPRAELNPALVPLLRAASDLTDYAVVFRYLEAPREPDEAEARAALETARRLFEKVCGLLIPPGQP
jgi:hypothetical protein